MTLGTATNFQASQALGLATSADLFEMAGLQEIPQQDIANPAGGITLPAANGNATGNPAQDNTAILQAGDADLIQTTLGIPAENLGLFDTNSIVGLLAVAKAMDAAQNGTITDEQKILLQNADNFLDKQYNFSAGNATDLDGGIVSGVIQRFTDWVNQNGADMGFTAAEQEEMLDGFTGQYDAGVDGDAKQINDVFAQTAIPAVGAGVATGTANAADATAGAGGGAGIAGAGGNDANSISLTNPNSITVVADGDEANAKDATVDNADNADADGGGGNGGDGGGDAAGGGGDGGGGDAAAGGGDGAGCDGAGGGGGDGAAGGGGGDGAAGGGGGDGAAGGGGGDAAAGGDGAGNDDN